MPRVPFCRYADDGLLHCRSRHQAEYVMKRITDRFRECGLEIHPDKSSIVYCQDRSRTEQHPRISFDFLGYTFRPRRCVDRRGNVHPNFLPAISRSSKKENQSDDSIPLPFGRYGGISIGISSNGFGENSKDFRNTCVVRNSIWIAWHVPIRIYSHTGNLAYSLVVRVIGAG